MVYRRTHQVVKRLAARRSAILAAARDAAAEGGMAAVQIAPVAVRASVAAGTVYRYFPSKADLISELIAEVSRDELAAIRRAADAAPGPSSALAAAVTTVAVHTLSQRRLAWGILAEPVDVDVSASRLASRREIAGEMAARIDAAVRAGHLPAQDTALAATALLGALHEALVGPLAPDNLDDPARMRDAVQTVTLLALRAVGVMDARARGLVVQQTLLRRKRWLGPKALVGRRNGRLAELACADPPATVHGVVFDIFCLPCPAPEADRGDAHHVGGAGDAERHAGDDDHALAGPDETVAERDLAGATHHVVLVARVFRHHAMHAPDHRQPASRRDVGRDRHDRRLRPFARDAHAVEPELVQQIRAGQFERLGDLPRGVRDGVAGGGFRARAAAR